ncbi:uncharacterized protein [Argopecten irradians]|uniref:uncharacterized protein n=1 Tax=Argopecten irradians TaxID=31199 RepID=UPI00371DDED7
MDSTTFLFVYMAFLEVINSYFSNLQLIESDKQKTWHESVQYCEGKGGRLLVMDSQEKWDYVTDHVQALGLTSKEYWISMKFNDSVGCDSNGHWNYQGWGKWDRNEPDKCRDEQCVRVKNNKMRTTECYKEKKAICQIDSTDSTTTEADSTTEMSTTVSTADMDTTSFVPTAISTTEAAVTSSGMDVTFSETTTRFNMTPSEQTTELDMMSSIATAISTQGNAISPPIVSNPVENGTCSRMCCTPINQTQLSHEELKQMQQALKYELLVNKTSLSSHRRRLVSVYDSRPSSVAMGGVASVILVTVFGFIVTLDCINLCRYMCNKKGGWKKNPPRQSTSCLKVATF